jgi:peptidyl-tRNA hydrolase, PTH1 family
MKLIVGLGNPGPSYDQTRHNAGFLVVDRLVRRWADAGTVPKARFSSVAVEAVIGTEKCLLLKPTTFMNLSGRSVAEAVGFYKLDPASDLLVLVDDVSIPTGTLRCRASGSAGGHNGLSDIQRTLGSETYPRLRIGIDACPPMMKLEDYVLGKFSPEQTALLHPALDRAAETVLIFVSKGLAAAMNFANAGPAPAAIDKGPAAASRPFPRSTSSTASTSSTPTNPPTSQPTVRPGASEPG